MNKSHLLPSHHTFIITSYLLLNSPICLPEYSRFLKCALQFFPIPYSFLYIICSRKCCKFFTREMNALETGHMCAHCGGLSASSATNLQAFVKDINIQVFLHCRGASCKISSGLMLTESLIHINHAAENKFVYLATKLPNGKLWQLEVLTVFGVWIVHIEKNYRFF